MQFFLALPLLLLALRPRVPGFRARLAAALAAIFVASTGWRLWSAATVPGGLRFPFVDLAEEKGLLQAVYFGELVGSTEGMGGLC